MGFSPHCPRCAQHSQGNHRRAQLHSHTETCRARLYEALTNAGAEKMLHADSQRVQTKAPRTSASPGPASPPTPSGPLVDDEDGAAIFAPDSDAEDTTEFWRVVDDDYEMLENARALESATSILPCDKDDMSDLDENDAPDASSPDIVHKDAEKDSHSLEDPVPDDEHPSVQLMDVLQCLGVSANDAANVAASLSRNKPKFRDLCSRMLHAQKFVASVTGKAPTFIELYG